LQCPNPEYSSIPVRVQKIMQIIIYTKAYCSFCFAAKRLLSKRGLDFKEIPVMGDAAAEKEMRQLTGGYTVPQILIDGKPIGGYTDLVELDMEGRL
jgi:GrxC family glutaredoxin